MVKKAVVRKSELQADLREANRVLNEVKTGKQELYSKEEFEKITGAKI